MKTTPFVLTLAVTGALTLVGCATTEQSTGSRENTIIAVEYGTVRNITQVDMKASTGTGAALGGGIGLAAASTASTETQIGAAAAGAPPVRTTVIGTLLPLSATLKLGALNCRLPAGGIGSSSAMVKTAVDGASRPAPGRPEPGRRLRKSAENVPRTP